MRFPIRINKPEELELWQRVQDKVAGLGATMSINTVILLLLQAWVDGKVTIGARRAA